MASSSQPQSDRPLLDPDQFEEAGRRVRQWLNSLAATVQQPVSLADDIAWEDGEPREEHEPDTTNRR